MMEDTINQLLKLSKAGQAEDMGRYGSSATGRNIW